MTESPHIAVALLLPGWVREMTVQLCLGQQNVLTPES